MKLNDVLQFKWKWRTYQARVLANADSYLSDGHIHIVAAPGFGKTTLGIELIRRLPEPARQVTTLHFHLWESFQLTNMLKYAQREIHIFLQRRLRKFLPGVIYVKQPDAWKSHPGDEG